MIFSFDISLPVWILFGASLLPVLWLLSVYRSRVARVGKTAASSPESMPVISDAEYPEVSVIIYSAGDPMRLESLLSDVFGQDYPTEMDVIVVNDGKIPEIKDVVSRLQASYRNLYLTFTPLESRNLSRRKLALTLGIKAARKDVVVLIDDSCEPASDWWLRLMAAPFADAATELVVGHAYPDTDTHIGAAERRFSLGADAVEYMSAVLKGRTFRANGHNLAYRTSVFFRNKGFSRSLNLHDGDDDIFINEVARPDNTVLSIKREAHMGVWHPDARKAYRREKTRRAFTARFVRKDTRRFFGFGSVMMWLWPLLAGGAIFMAWPNLTIAAAEAAVGLILWIPLSITWSRTLKALSCPVSGWLMPWRLMTRPAITLRYRFMANRHKSNHYTWKN